MTRLMKATVCTVISLMFCFVSIGYAEYWRQRKG